MRLMRRRRVPTPTPHCYFPSDTPIHNMNSHGRTMRSHIHEYKRSSGQKPLLFACMRIRTRLRLHHDHLTKTSDLIKPSFRIEYPKQNYLEIQLPITLLVHVVIRSNYGRRMERLIAYQTSSKHPVLHRQYILISLSDHS